MNSKSFRFIIDSKRILVAIQQIEPAPGVIDANPGIVCDPKGCIGMFMIAYAKVNRIFLYF
jgi:hypothetical protein